MVDLISAAVTGINYHFLSRAIRYGKWKLVVNEDGGNYKGRSIPEAEYFLSNMQQDVTETKNLADEYPSIVKKLCFERFKRIHEGWLKGF